jgi:phosphoglycerate dehydrogenase-like enzyme
MSEHIAALALAAAKRLFIEHDNLKRGDFDQRSSNKMLRGGVCGILGFGNVGVATARLMRAFGMQIHVPSSSEESANHRFRGGEVKRNRCPAALSTPLDQEGYRGLQRTTAPSLAPGFAT